MEDITAEVTKIEELFLRFNLHRFAPMKKQLLFCGTGCLIIGAVLIGLNIFFVEDTHTAPWGIIFTAFALIFFILFFFFSKRAVKRLIKKRISCPERTVYRFGQHGFVVESYYSDEFCRMDINYSDVERVCVLDEKTVFIQLADKTFCSVSGEKCGSIVALLSSKLPPQCFK